MEIISMHDLKAGDIYTNQIKLHGREAFIVTAKDNEWIWVISRNDPSKKTIRRKIMNQDVIRLRHED